jgi:5'-3' exonuclease
MAGPLAVVDAPYLLYRSFFALPDSIKGADGQPVNALLGAVNVLLRLAADRELRAIVACFGAEAAAYRVELYEPYHAERPPVPDALAWQFERAPELFDAFGWSSASSEGFEADDLLGSFAAVESDAGGETLILTGDRDMYQCAGERVHVVMLKPGTAGFDDVDAEEVRRRYGIPPALVPDFIALRGDPSDGLPGAPGIGPKTAAELLGKYGSLDDVLAAAGEQRPKVAASLRDHADALRAYREIATLQAIEVSRPPDRATDLEGGAAAARALGLNRLAQRLADADTLRDL